MSQQLITELKNRRKIGNALVFEKKDGNHTSQNTTRGRWKRLLKKAGISYRKFHAIRHTTISHLLSHDVPIIEVSTLAGHHAPSFTLDVYGHAIPTKGDSITSILDKQAKN